MANGSFGLSGLPTAPTTIASSGSGENNALSAATVPVFSTSGFNSGDLIYLKQGECGIPSGTGLTGGLVLQDSVAPIFSGTTGSYLRWPNVAGANRGSNPCAKLTDGNTVFVYYDITSTYPTFVVLDSAGVVVVAPTTISTTIFSTVNTILGVVALVGGGFAVVGQDNQAGANRIFSAIYTNAGGVTTAPVRDTSITVSPSSMYRIAIVALPNGGFAVAVRNSSNFTQVRFFSATTALGAWTTPTGLTASSNDDTMTLLARTNSTVVLTISDGTSAVLFNISTANVTTGSGRLGASLTTMTSVLLADNSVAVFGGVSASGLTYYNITGTTSATWSAAVEVNSGGTNNIPVAYLTSAGNILIWSFSANNPQYQFCTTSGVSLSGSPYPLIAAAQTFQAYPYPGFIENGSTVTVYWTPVVTAQDSTNPIMTSMNVNSSTYALQRFNSTDGGALATSTAVSLSGYNRTNSNPNGASYFAQGSGNVFATSTTGATLVAQTVIESTACNAMSAAALPDGGCVILYKASGSPYNVKYAVFSKAGVLQTIVSVGGGIATGASARIAVLSDGKICVVYYTTTTVLSFAIYSTSYVLLNSGLLPGAASLEDITTNNTRAASLAALPDGYFVVSWAVTGMSFRTYTNTGTAYSAEYSNVGSTGATDVNFAVSACLDGSVIFFWKNSTTQYKSGFYRKTTGSNVYTSAAGTSSFNTVTSSQINRQVALCPDGGFFLSYRGNISDLILRKINLVGTSIGSDASSGADSAASSVGLAVAGSGMMLAYSVGSNTLYYYSSSGTLAGTFALTFSNNAGSSNVVLAGSYGNNAFIGILNSSTFPTYALVSAGPVTYPMAYTTENFSTPQTASPATGYYLIGVAATDCAPGGTGNVQINGAVSLNSSYPSSTAYQAFDFSNPTLYGVRGTVVGRSVTMQGNV